MDIYLKYFKHKQLFIVAEDAIYVTASLGLGIKRITGICATRLSLKRRNGESVYCFLRFAPIRKVT